MKKKLSLEKIDFGDCKKCNKKRKIHVCNFLQYINEYVFIFRVYAEYIVLLKKPIFFIKKKKIKVLYIISILSSLFLGFRDLETDTESGTLVESASCHIRFFADKHRLVD